jgi:oleate hydratase
MFMSREPGDRPLPVSAGSVNLAFISKLVEIPDE